VAKELCRPDDRMVDADLVLDSGAHGDVLVGDGVPDRARGAVVDCAGVDPGIGEEGSCVGSGGVLISSVDSQG